MSELVRFSVAMPEDLMDELDRYTARRGIAKNRSEAIRDLVRGALIEEEVEDPDSSIFGTLTMVFNHHSNDLRDKLDAIQHEHVDEIVSTVHVHLDEENCLEVVLMRGQSRVIRSIADALLGTKGVLHGKLVVLGRIAGPVCRLGGLVLIVVFEHLVDAILEALDLVEHGILVDMVKVDIGPSGFRAVFDALLGGLARLLHLLVELLE